MGFTPRKSIYSFAPSHFQPAPDFTRRTTSPAWADLFGYPLRPGKKVYHFPVERLLWWHRSPSNGLPCLTQATPMGLGTLFARRPFPFRAPNSPCLDPRDCRVSFRPRLALLPGFIWSPSGPFHPVASRPASEPQRRGVPPRRFPVKGPVLPPSHSFFVVNKPPPPSTERSGCFFWSIQPWLFFDPPVP